MPGSDELRGHAAMLMSPLDVVLVEDNEALREETRVYLERLGHAVRACSDGAELDRCVAQTPPDLVILDLNLPGEDGLSISRRLRARWPLIGIVMLTARAAAAQRVEGYAGGADVYLTKPADLIELRAVITSLSRRLERQHAGGWRLDLREWVVHGPHGSVSLTGLEAGILHALALAPERELATDVLLDRIHEWHNNEPSRNALSIAVSRLRAKLKDVQAPDCVKAVRGTGYRLTMPITVIG